MKVWFHVSERETTKFVSRNTIQKFYDTISLWYNRVAKGVTKCDICKKIGNNKRTPDDLKSLEAN